MQSRTTTPSFYRTSLSSLSADSVVSLVGLRNGRLLNISAIPQGMHNEAIPLLERAYSVRRKRLGENHPSTVETWISLEHVRNHAREEGTGEP